METQIRDKIENLLLTGNKPEEEFLQPGDGPLDNYIRKINVLDAMSKELKTLAREAGTLLGRRVSFQTMDGQAHYVVTNVLKSKVVVQWVNYDEAYIDDRLGRCGTLDMNYIKPQIEWEDKLERARL